MDTFVTLDLYHGYTDDSYQHRYISNQLYIPQKNGNWHLYMAVMDSTVWNHFDANLGTVIHFILYAPNKSILFFPIWPVRTFLRINR